MCSQYWTLRVDVPLPCGHTNDDWQTHFMGGVGSCMNYYRVEQDVEELETYSGPLPQDDWFIGECTPCHQFYSLPAEIKQGRVVSIGVPVPD